MDGGAEVVAVQAPDIRDGDEGLPPAPGSGCDLGQFAPPPYLAELLQRIEQVRAEAENGENAGLQQEATVLARYVKRVNRRAAEQLAEALERRAAAVSGVLDHYRAGRRKQQTAKATEAVREQGRQRRRKWEPYRRRVRELMDSGRSKSASINETLLELAARGCEKSQSWGFRYLDPDRPPQ